MRNSSKLALILVFLAISIGSGVYVVWRTVESLGNADDLADVAASLWRLVLLGLACGVISFAVVEFFKRLSPLRSWYNETAVLRWFSKADPSEMVDWISSLKQANEHRIIYWDAPLGQLTAQISTVLAQSRLAAPPDVETIDEVKANRLVETELTLDRLQAQASSGWVRLLRGISALTASIIAGIASLASNGAPSVVVGAFLFGLTIGGPLSWLIRDLARAIESRARY